MVTSNFSPPPSTADKGTWKNFYEDSSGAPITGKSSYKVAVEAAFSSGVGDRNHDGTVNDDKDKMKWLVDEMGTTGAAEYWQGKLEEQVANGTLDKDQLETRKAEVQAEITAAANNSNGVADSQQSGGTTEATDVPEETSSSTGDAAASTEPGADPKFKFRTPMPEGTKPPVKLSSADKAAMDLSLQKDTRSDPEPRLASQVLKYGVDKTLAYQYDLIDKSKDYATKEEKEAAKLAIRSKVADAAAKNDSEIDANAAFMSPTPLSDADKKRMGEDLQKDTSTDHDERLAQQVKREGADKTLAYQYSLIDKSDEYANEDERVAAKRVIRQEVTDAMNGKTWENPPAAAAAPAPEPKSKPKPAPAPEPKSKPAPAPAPEPKPKPAPEPKPAPAPAPEPKPKPKPKPEADEPLDSGGVP
jgi:hypothetical protein